MACVLYWADKTAIGEFSSVGDAQSHATFLCGVGESVDWRPRSSGGSTVYWGYVGGVVRFQIWSDAASNGGSWQ